MVVRGRGPYLAKRTLRHQALVPHSVPERAAYCPSIGSPVENGAHHFNFAGPRIPVLADVAVEAQCAIVSSLAHVLLSQKMNGQNGGMSAVSAAECKGSILQIRERRNRTSGNGDDLRHPAQVGVAHRDSAAEMPAPFIGLQVSEVGVPGDIDTGPEVAGLGEECTDLSLVALK